ncbi:MAG: tetratricopeptide repeat protein [Polyangiaceae bacterium]
MSSAGAARGTRRNSLVGRDHETDALGALLDRRWHVTVVGTAGIGKTRLANEAMNRRGGAHFFCDLTQAVDADDVLNAVARLLAIEPGEGSAVDRIASILASQGGACRLLDGVDRLAQGVWEKTIAAFLEACPELHVLVTARARLRVEGEAAFPLGPLDVTAPAHGTSNAELLFLQLAEDVLGRDLRESGEVPADVRSLVRVLDGVPLALEIAASVLNVLSPYEFLQRGARLLDASTSGGSWGGGSLRAAFEVSWERLSEDARVALQSLSVFVGDFDLAAAEAVNGKSAIELLSRLCEASLVSSSVTGNRTRFRMFECVRQFVTDRNSDPEILAQAMARHAAFFGREATSWTHKGEMGDRAGAIEWLTMEESNLVAVAERAVARKAALTEEDIAPGAATLAGLAWMWLGRGPLQPHERLLNRMEAMIPLGSMPDSLAIATFQLATANVWRHRGDLARAAQIIEDTIERARRLKLPYFEARCLLERARVARLRGDREAATTSMTEAAALAKSNNDDVLSVLAILSTRLLSSLDEASLREASRLAAKVGDPLVTARVELAFGTFCYAVGKMEEALVHLRLVTKASAKLHQHTWDALAGIVAGNVLAELGRADEARTMFEKTLKIGLSTAHRRSEAEARGNIALLDFEAGRLVQAAEGFTKAIELFSKNDPSRLFFSAALAGVEANDPDRSDAAIDRFVSARNDAGKLTPAFSNEIDQFSDTFHLTDAARQPARPLDESPPTTTALVATRVARRVRVSLQDRLAKTAVAIARDGSWFRPPMDAVVSLEARPVLRALLRELVQARLGASHVVAREDLVRAIWPDERSSRQSMGNRLSVAISTLKSLGLRSLVVTPQGVSLDVSVSIEPSSVR